MIGGDSSSGEGKSKPVTLSSTMAAMGFIRSSAFTRDCACRAFDAFALKRSTKACMCARAASCFFFSDISCSSRARRTVSKVS
jgi:hypothetical protein